MQFIPVNVPIGPVDEDMDDKDNEEDDEDDNKGEEKAIPAPIIASSKLIFLYTYIFYTNKEIAAYQYTVAALPLMA